jgi:hypothetical protein
MAPLTSALDDGIRRSGGKAHMIGLSRDRSLDSGAGRQKDCSYESAKVGLAGNTLGGVCIIIPSAEDICSEPPGKRVLDWFMPLVPIVYFYIQNRWRIFWF